MLTSLYLAGEDEPTLAVGRKLVAAAPPLFVYREENGRGYGTLKTKTTNYQQMGLRGLPVMMITDLDRSACPSELISNWLGAIPSTGFLFRVCVREVEAWLLADREAMAAFLTIPCSRLPMQPELLLDPKAVLIRLAQRAPRPMRVGLTPIGSATIGPGYNALLSAFVRDHWSSERASLISPSLARARQRLMQLAASLV